MFSLARTPVYLYTRINTLTPTDILPNIHVYAHTYITVTDTHKYTRMDTHALTERKLTCIYIYIYIYIYIHK